MKFPTLAVTALTVLIAASQHSDVSGAATGPFAGSADRFNSGSEFTIRAAGVPDNLCFTALGIGAGVQMLPCGSMGDLQYFYYDPSQRIRFSRIGPYCLVFRQQADGSSWYASVDDCDSVSAVTYGASHGSIESVLFPGIRRRCLRQHAAVLRVRPERGVRDHKRSDVTSNDASHAIAITFTISKFVSVAIAFTITKSIVSQAPQALSLLGH